MKLIFPVLFVALITSYTNSATTATAVATSHAPDEAAIKKAVDNAYSCISFKTGQQPDYDGVKKYFMPQAQFFNFRNDTLEVFTLNQFAVAYKEFITSNSIRSFYEEEITGTTEQFGRVAHRISTYKTYLNTMDSAAERGVNSFQLIKTDSGWKVSSIIWDVESPKLKIPEYYLKAASIK